MSSKRMVAWVKASVGREENVVHTKSPFQVHTCCTSRLHTTSVQSNSCFHRWDLSECYTAALFSEQPNSVRITSGEVSHQAKTDLTQVFTPMGSERNGDNLLYTIGQ